MIKIENLKYLISPAVTAGLFLLSSSPHKQTAPYGAVCAKKRDIRFGYRTGEDHPGTVTVKDVC